MKPIISHIRKLRRTALLIAAPLICLAFLLSANISRTASSDQDKYSRQYRSPESEKKEGTAPEQIFETIQIPDANLPSKTPGSGVPSKSGNSPNKTAAINLGGETEPNGTSATATPITGASARIRGTVFPAADVDFYSFTATVGDRIYAATQTLFDASASGDSVLDVINTDGITVIENDPNDGTFNASSSSIAGAVMPATGTFFLRVRHNVATGTIRPYDLYFTRQTGSPVAETESNNTPATANPLPASGWVSGTISAVSPGESDFYSITLAAGDTVYLSLDMNPERDANVWNGRLGFALFGNSPANQILLANDANTGAVLTDPNSEAFFFTVKDPGTYFVYVDSIVAAGLGANATYNLSVAVHPATTTGTCTTYTSTNVPQTIPTGPGMVSSTITVPGNPRIADLNVQINLNHTFMQDLDVHLVSPAGNDNGLFTDIGAATVGGPQTLMDIIVDDQAGLPPAFALSASFIIQPELAYRLGWFNGENGGGTWTLVIRDDATGDGGTLNSWSITICEPPAAPSCGVGFSPTTVFSTNFESGAAGFTHSGTADEWELGLPTFIPITTCNSGVNCWKTDLDNTYEASSNQNLVSPPINLAGLSGPVLLSWAQRYHIESANFDHYSVDVREVGNPSNTRRVYEWLDATMNNTVGNPAVTIAESSGWSVLTADISSFAGLNVEVVFHLDSDTTVQLAGVAIDDVSVTACMAAPTCMITCPANVTQSNDPNQCGAVVNYPAPTTSGSCGTISCSPPSGSFFPVGTTTVTCQNTGGSPSCTFTVTVNDTQNPSITCPANITVSNDPNQCGAVVNYPAPTITDNCPGTFTATCTPPSGSFFPKGTTTVTCTVTGFMSSCTFTVTVNDTQPPTITCPANQISVVPPPAPGANCSASTTQSFTYPPPTASDNCPGVTVACVPPSGSPFPVGTTTVTCTATDASGNTATCSFTLQAFNVFLQDVFNPNTVLLFNTQTGAYRFCCNGTTYTGTGTVNVQGCIYTLQHNAVDRRVMGSVDFSIAKGSGSLQVPPGKSACTLSDTNIRNNTAACGVTP